MHRNGRLQKVLRHLDGIRTPVVRAISRRRFILLPRVFDPSFFDSRLLAECVRRCDSGFDKILDLGTGCGIQAIFASKHAKSVTATDISRDCLENARLNVQLHGVESKVSLVRSDLFSKIQGRYDLIIFNPPFFSEKPRNVMEKAVTDLNHNLLKAFLRSVRDHLSKKGKVMAVFSDFIDVDLDELIERCGLRYEVLREGRQNSATYSVYLIRPATGK